MDAREISRPGRKHAIPNQETESSLSLSFEICVTGFKCKQQTSLTGLSVVRGTQERQSGLCQVPRQPGW